MHDDSTSLHVKVSGLVAEPLLQSLQESVFACLLLLKLCSLHLLCFVRLLIIIDRGRVLSVLVLVSTVLGTLTLLF